MYTYSYVRTRAKGGRAVHTGVHRACAHRGGARARVGRAQRAHTKARKRRKALRVCGSLRVVFVMLPSRRPGRAAAAAARENLDRQAQPVVISDSDGEEFSGVEGEEGGESDSSSSSVEQQPELTAYELERDANIARNKEVLAHLGLANAEPTASRAKVQGSREPAEGRASSASRRVAPQCASSAAGSTVGRSTSATSGSTSRMASKKRKGAQERGAPPAARGSQETTSAESSGSRAAPLGMDVQDAEACFALLCNGDPATGRLTVDSIRKAARDLGLDVEQQFSEENVLLMIDSFDQAGTGSIELHEFRTIARQCARTGGSN